MYLANETSHEGRLLAALKSHHLDRPELQKASEYEKVIAPFSREESSENQPFQRDDRVLEPLSGNGGVSTVLHKVT